MRVHLSTWGLSLLLIWCIESFPSMYINLYRHNEKNEKQLPFGEGTCRVFVHSLIEMSGISLNGTCCSSGPLPSDCWNLCLQYLSSPRDIGRFRSLSPRHNQLYQNMMKMTKTDFHHIFRNYSNRKRYRSNKDIERAIPLIPCGSIDLEDELQSVSHLWHYHLTTGRNIVRGVITYSGLSFLSMFLQHDKVPTEHILLICICNHDRIEDVRPYWDRGEIQYMNFDHHDLHGLWQRDYVIFDGLSDCGAWSMEPESRRFRRRLVATCLSSARELRPTRICKKLETWVLTNPRQFWTCYALLAFSVISILVCTVIGIIK